MTPNSYRFGDDQIRLGATCSRQEHCPIGKTQLEAPSGPEAELRHWITTNARIERGRHRHGRIS